MFSIVSSAFWHIAYWVRFEQETGTLEAVYITPTSSSTLIAGVSLYSAVRSVTAALLAYLLGCLIFGVNPFQGDVLLALLFVFVGLIPLYGVTFLFGAVVLKIKESQSVINLMQWLVSFLMGIFFPVTVLPPFLRAIAQLFPPTWMVNGVRSSLLGIGYFLETWYFDLAVMWAFLFLAPLIGMWIFRRTEFSLRRNDGIGKF
jgi:ABC-2 type transport system permease protein